MDAKETKVASLEERLLPPVSTIKLVDGSDLAVPTALPLGKQIILARQLKGLLTAVPILKTSLDLENPNVGQLLSSILESLDILVSDQLSEMLGTILDKDKDWINNNVDLVEALGVLIPFFIRIGQLVTLKFRGVPLTSVPKK